MSRRNRRVALDLLRYGVPGMIVLVGFVVLVAGGGSRTALQGAALFIGAGVAVLLLNLLYRIGVQGEGERDREARARDYFDEHGHWPDERRR